jgi:ribonuclease HI
MRADPRTIICQAMKHVKLYTDGACSGNPGPGGYGVVLLYDSHRKELSGGFRRTTNNRMEILAAIAGLEALKEPCRVTLYSDSQYLVNAIEKDWAQRWQANGWMRNKKEKAVNPDLWERLLELCKIHKVQFEWLRGHAGQEENERCDELATAAARGPNPAIDEGYEKASP